MTAQVSDTLFYLKPIECTGPVSGWRPLVVAVFAAVLVGLAGCGPVQLVATSRIPTPLIVKLPVTVALFMPQQFAQYIHKEERWGTDWNIHIGKAQTDAMSQLVNAMFDKVIVVDSLAAGGALGSGIAAIIEPSVEEYAFVTPRDAGSPFFAVSIKYRVNVYMPDGKLADSWGFTGYGTSPAGGLSNTEPLQNATALAMRDAGAKLVVEFRDQPVVRGLFPEAQSADDPPSVPAGTPAAPETPSTGASGEGALDEAGSAESAPSEPSAAPSPGEEEVPEPGGSKQEEPAEEPEPKMLDVEALALSMMISSNRGQR